MCKTVATTAPPVATSHRCAVFSATSHPPIDECVYLFIQSACDDAQLIQGKIRPRVIIAFKVIKVIQVLSCFLYNVCLGIIDLLLLISCSIYERRLIGTNCISRYLCNCYNYYNVISRWWLGARCVLLLPSHKTNQDYIIFFCLRSRKPALHSGVAAKCRFYL